MGFKVITAPEKVNFELDTVYCFLAGGISDCKDWQKETIDFLKDFRYEPDEPDLVILNPRRSEPVNCVREQIEWEFYNISACDIFSMYFPGGEHKREICMYELGRNLALGSRFPSRFIISVQDGYKRLYDVKIQSELVLGLDIVKEHMNPTLHAIDIYNRYKWTVNYGNAGNCRRSDRGGYRRDGYR